ncbi:tenascin-X [Comamonas sp. JC664]|uniref:tenascin-X n=1 Tax=Comamonas sp. JC664 TaxID=2801917 RepID=UPI00174EAC6B|nr:tenascin-X [Comamonas sp. JC664]MBL0698142.1 hypothetical protein [Comamonas sp. JC664]GHG88584.1 hypothetical protein GCM10012319_47320 [Comamonas sp. KCTC 72670]
MTHATKAVRVGRRWSGILGWMLALGWVMACRDAPPLSDAVGRLRLSVQRVDFPAAYPGSLREAEVRVLNGGRAPLDVTWTEVPAPFSVEAALPVQVLAGEVPVRLRFAPQAEGTFQVTVIGTASDGGQVELVLAGEARPVPECFTPVTCAAAAFDRVTERCVESALPDGTACDPGNACLVGATCQAGRCRGVERACDDGDACTTDVCHVLDGCQAVPAPPCPSAGPCQVGTCDPRRGCSTAPAPNGTLCGGGRGTCEDVDVCLDGACVQRDLPEGFVCEAATPCQAAGQCRGGTCARPAARALSPDWQYDAREEGQQLQDLLVGPEGDVTLTGFYGTPLLDAAGKVPVRASNPARRCMLWNDRLLCMDMPVDGTVSLLERSTGSPRWTFTLGKARPDIRERTQTLFLARLAVMAPDRLAALFEAYPADQPRDTGCRNYFLVVLDAYGHMVSAQELTDPLLAECNHPHPFGLASDAVGGLYIAFAPTVNTGAPLESGAPTLLMAFSSDGVPGWRRTDPMRAGELAVVNGLLLPERGFQALGTRDGAPVGQTVPQPFGRVVATRDVVVPSAPGTTVNATVSSSSAPPAATELRGFRLPDMTPAWTYTVKAGQSLSTKELRLATFPRGAGLPPEPLVLTHAVGAGNERLLVGVRTVDGGEAFQCPLTYGPRTLPQLMELAPDTLFLMEGALSCGECDPPFANSQPRFLRFTLPGLEPSREPWPGTFGGPGHGHHEQAAH